MSFLPRPADSVQGNRPFVVRAPPAGWLPIWVILPAGLRSRPLPSWSLDVDVRPSFFGSVAAMHDAGDGEGSG